jgi:hypothetical protein
LGHDNVGSTLNQCSRRIRHGRWISARQAKIEFEIFAFAPAEFSQLSNQCGPQRLHFLFAECADHGDNLSPIALLRGSGPRKRSGYARE